MLIVLGYRFNRSDGRIEQGGLLQFDTRPGGADVTVDGATLGSRTATKATVSAGQHTVTMSRNGYNAWQKTVNVAPGSIVWLDYARLIPNDLKTEAVATFTHVSGSLVSFDTKWMAVKEDAQTPLITLVDISREAVRQSSIEIPTSTFTASADGKAQSFILETWDPSNRYILVKHVFNGDQLEWLVVDTQNVNQTVNVTKLLNVPMTKVLFSNTNSNTLFVQVGADVRKVDISAATLSRPLVSNVAEFWLYDRSVVVFTTVLSTETGTRSAGYYEDGAEKPHFLKTFTDDGKPPLKVALGKYFDEPYVALSYGEEVSIYRGKMPSGQADVGGMTHEKKFTQSGGVEYLEIRNNGRFIIAQNGGEFQVYDNELKQLNSTTLKETVGAKKLNWLDGYHAWSDLGGMLRLYEFDGANQQDIMPVVPGYAATLAQDGVFLYGFTQANDGLSLSRARLQN